MIRFTYKDKSITISADNISALSNKHTFRMFEEVVTQQLKSILIGDLSPIRDTLEKENTEIICQFDSVNEKFDFQWIANPDTADLIAQHLK